MKIVLIFALIILAMPTSAAGQKNKGKASQSLTLHGQIEAIEIARSDSTSVSYVLRLKLELHNGGTKSILLLKDPSPELVGAELAKSPVGLSKREYLLVEYAGPGVDLSPKWRGLREFLDQAAPPENKVYSLRPNESWEFTGSVGIAIPTERGKNTFFPKREPLESIKRISPIWLRVICQIWPLNLERSGANRLKLRFGHKLQQRWEKFGHLYLEGVRSEPIELDFK